MTAKNKGNERERVKNDFLQKMNLQKNNKKKIEKDFFSNVVIKRKGQKGNLGKSKNMIRNINL